MHKHLPSVFGDNTFLQSANICHLWFSPPTGHSGYEQKGECWEPEGEVTEEGPIILILHH